MFPIFIKSDPSNCPAEGNSTEENELPQVSRTSSAEDKLRSSAEYKLTSAAEDKLRSSAQDKTKGVFLTFILPNISHWDIIMSLIQISRCLSFLKLWVTLSKTAATVVEPESPGAMAALNLSIIGDTKLMKTYQQVKPTLDFSIYLFYHGVDVVERQIFASIWFISSSANQFSANKQIRQLQKTFPIQVVDVGKAFIEALGALINVNFIRWFLL